ncbi:hypothetical protein DYB34_005236 [Aphanomyces astaci]|uniref:Dynein heavy chain coiled coil stalk domain-containing protein n=1 Tax=Aphanomyces astaci TaxID=112090 RepID=A0A397FI75_APHAT|nr:hypothetical protein DYB34_005236 [Aphanomyces astaci]RHZ27045.1 hypothetical protein DYB31_000177 [Aphanomyces astaci]
MAQLVCAARTDPPRQVTCGPQMKLHLNVFQGFVLPAFSSSQIPALVDQLVGHPRMRKSTTFAYAYRILEPSTDKDTTSPTSHHDSEGTTEGSDDGLTLGAGDKLLQVLRRWQVCNAIVVVNRSDLSLTGRLIVAQIYKLVVESAKLALEQFALDSLQVLQCSLLKAAKLALQDASNNQKSSGVGEVPHLTVQEMTYAGAPTHMVNGTVLGTKQGRINHFQGAQEGDDHAMTTNRPKSLESLGISKDDLAALKVVRMPPKELHMVLVCVAVLLNVPDLSWLGCRDMLNAASFCANVLGVRPRNVTKKQATRVRAILQEPQFVPELIRRVSVVGAALLSWVMQIMDEYDALRLGFDLRGPEEDDSQGESFPPPADVSPWSLAPELPPPSQQHPPLSEDDDATAIIPTDLFMPKVAPFAVHDTGRMLLPQ